jgi:RHS repeat-associated protein
VTDEVTGQQLYFNGLSDGLWHHMIGSLSGRVGSTISYAEVGIHANAPNGYFDLRLANVGIVRADGSFVPMYTGQAGVSVANFNGSQCGASQLTSGSVVTPTTDPAINTNYYLDDHLGTTQVELNGGGWPVWEGEFSPFGVELPDGNTAMHYKFTGKEKDSESGLDYFGARYYASNMGRWMSPDWSASPEAVPYADLANPQSLNLYGYVGNNPLSKADPDGHCTNGGQQKGFWWCAFNDSDQDADRARANLAAYKNISINGKTPSDAAKGLSNTQTVNLDRSVFNYISSQAMSSPGMMIGLAIVPGGAEEVVGREIGAIDVAGVGLGITGTRAATTVAERLAIEAAESNPAAGKVLQTTLNDSRWPSSQGWVKMESRSPGGVVVHWVRNTITGAAADFKLK